MKRDTMSRAFLGYTESTELLYVRSGEGILPFFAYKLTQDS